MVTLPAKARRLLFIAGLAFIAFGGIGLLFHAPWGDVANSLFTIFGTTASFAQFSIGFSSLKPADNNAALAQAPAHPDATPPGYPNPGSPQAHLPYPPPPLVKQPAATPPAHRAAIAILSGPSGQIHLELTQLTFGRLPDNKHVLNDPQVSGHHAIIRKEGQAYTITDLGSTNGTYVNGQQLTARVPHTLSPGDTIRIGITMFTYQVNMAPEYAKTVYAPEPLPPPPPPPPQSYKPRASIPVWGTQKSYRGSGIALLLACGCSIIYLLLFLSAPNPNERQASTQLVVFGLTGVFVLCALRGFHAKQAHNAGWLGTIGIMLLAAAWILNILISCIFVANASSNQPFSQAAISSILTLYDVNWYFIVIGDILLGISMIRAHVYPKWTGVSLIIVGCLSTMYALIPQAAVIEVMAILLWVALTIQCALILMKRAPNYLQQSIHF